MNSTDSKNGGRPPAGPPAVHDATDTRTQQVTDPQRESTARVGQGAHPSRDLDAVWRWLSDVVEAAEDVAGPVPLLGTPEWSAADDRMRWASVARYAIASLDENEPHMIAYRIAVELSCARRADVAHRRALRDASHDVHGGDREFWRRWAAHRVPFDELQRRRAVPGPMTRPSGGVA